LEEGFVGSNGSIRANLIQLIDDSKARIAIESKSGLEYIEELATELLNEVYSQIEKSSKEHRKNDEMTKTMTKFQRINSLHIDALSTFKDCFDYAYFLYLSNLIPTFVSLEDFNWKINWISNVVEKYPRDSVTRVKRIVRTTSEAPVTITESLTRKAWKFRYGRNRPNNS
jgi:hypothetical protein